MILTKSDTWTRVTEFVSGEINVLSECLDFRTEESPDTGFFLERDGDNYKFLTGLLPYVKEKLLSVVQFSIVDQTCQIEKEVPISDPLYLDGVELRDYQVRAAVKALYHGRGILDITTRGGKTEILAYIAKYYLALINPNGKVVVIVRTTSLMEQTYSRFLSRGLSSVGRLNGTFREFNKDIVVCVIDSLYNLVKNEDHPDGEFLERITAVLIDESHHLGAPSYAKSVLSIDNPDLLIGVSGTPFNCMESQFHDHRDITILGLLHRVLVKIPSDYLARQGHLALGHVFPLRYQARRSPYTLKNYNMVYSQFISENKTRNLLVCQAAKEFDSVNFSCLILVIRIEHGKNLLRIISEFSPKSLFVSGKTGILRVYNEGVDFSSLPDGWEIYQDKEDRKLGREWIKYPADYPYKEELNSGSYNILIGSTIFDEGEDIPNLDALILAGGEGKSCVKAIQRSARVMTRKSGDNQVFIVDFLDNHHPYTKRHSELRLQTYRDRGYHVHPSDWGELQQSISNSVYRRLGSE